MQKLRSRMTLALIAVRYAEPKEGEPQVMHNPVFSIPNEYLRPIIRCLMANGGKIPNMTFTTEECEKAKPYIDGTQKIPEGYRPLKDGEFPVNRRKWQ